MPVMSACRLTRQRRSSTGDTHVRIRLSTAVLAARYCLDAVFFSWRVNDVKESLCVKWNLPGVGCCCLYITAVVAPGALWNYEGVVR